MGAPFTQTPVSFTIEATESKVRKRGFGLNPIHPINTTITRR